MIAIKDLQKKLMEELDIGHLSTENQEMVVNEIGGMLYRRLLLVIFDLVPNEEHQKLKQFIDANLENEITALIQKHIPNLEEVIENELSSSMKDYREALSIK